MKNFTNLKKYTDRANDILGDFEEDIDKGYIMCLKDFCQLSKDFKTTGKK
jgi:hypothetical protein